MEATLAQKIDGITPLAVYNDLRKIAKGDYRNRDSRLAAVDARMTRLESELADYATQSQWAEDELREWNHGVARKIKEGKADPGPRMFVVFQHALGRLPHTGEG
jgi:hypothetical protein